MRAWPLTDEAFWMKPVGGIENTLSVLTDFGSKTIMDHGGSHHADSRVTMVVVVPGEEGLAKSTAVLNAAKAVGKLGPVLHGSELTFRERIVVGGIGAAVRLGHTEIGQE